MIDKFKSIPAFLTHLFPTIGLVLTELYLVVDSVCGWSA